jgi:hypothetical protein
VGLLDAIRRVVGNTARGKDLSADEIRKLRRNPRRGNEDEIRALSSELLEEARELRSLRRHIVDQGESLKEDVHRVRDGESFISAVEECNTELLNRLEKEMKKSADGLNTEEQLWKLYKQAFEQVSEQHRLVARVSEDEETMENLKQTDTVLKAVREDSVEPVEENTDAPEMGRREFLGATAGAVAAVSGARTLSDSGIYDASTEEINKMVYEWMNSGVPSEFPTRSHYRTLKELPTFRAAVEEDPVDVKIYRLCLRPDSKGRRYERKKISEYFESQFSSGLDINLRISWSTAKHETLRSLLRRPPGAYRDLLEGADLSDVEVRKKVVRASHEIARDLSVASESKVVVLSLDTGFGFLSQRGLSENIGAPSIMVGDLDQRSFAYVTLHELGHAVGLPHSYGDDVMSYSPQRFILGELSLMDNAFQSESKENWNALKEMHRQYSS